MRHLSGGGEGSKYLQKTYLIKNYYTKIYKELIKLKNKKTKNLIKNWGQRPS